MYYVPVGGHVFSLFQMLCVPNMNIGLTARAFLQDHRRKAYLQPSNWSSIIGPAGDADHDLPQFTNMDVDDDDQIGGVGGRGSQGVFGTTSTTTIGGALSRSEVDSLHLHLSESELHEDIIEEEEEEEDVAHSFTTPTAQSKDYF